MACTFSRIPRARCSTAAWRRPCCICSFANAKTRERCTRRRLEKVSLDRQTIEARLQALQAQIEPHFLFNTLANIKLLYETESSRAKPLIHDLAAYLRTALPQMRDMRSTLARELDLAQAYLRVLKVRMGERLEVVIDVPADLREATLPPMMLLTLVENAIKHGLGSLPQGGTITIRAERSDERLRVSRDRRRHWLSEGFWRRRRPRQHARPAHRALRRQGSPDARCEPAWRRHRRDRTAL